MNRLIAAVAFALSAAAPAVAQVGAPFEQTQLDRVLPNVAEPMYTYERISKERMPFEQTELDRGQVGIAEPVLLTQVGNASYRSDESGESPFANDHNFIAPPQ